MDGPSLRPSVSLTRRRYGMRLRSDCRRLTAAGLIVAALAASGCLNQGAHKFGPDAPAASLVAPASVPSELSMITLPPYAIGSPDILLIEVYTLPREALGPAAVLSPQPIT